MTPTDTLDLVAVKRGQQAMWASGDYGAIATLIHPVAERLVDSVDPAAGSSVLDVAGGGDVARKGGPGIARADALVVNKTDLAPHVGVDVEQMVRDATAARDGGKVIALSRTDPDSVAQLTAWVLAVLEGFRAGERLARDPGPMAPHAHADGTVHSHPR